MTEAEAKEKWCPFARVTVFGTVDVAEDGTTTRNVAVVGQGSNRIVCTDESIHAQIGAMLDHHGWTRCIGSKCMAWAEHNAGGRCGMVPV